VAWRLSNENFISNLNFFNDLKLRLSYGETGNQEGVNLYDYIALIDIAGAYPFGNGGQFQSAFQRQMVSPSRTWETIANRNIGVDATILSNRLNFTFDYFVKKNLDMLIPVTYPAVLGAIPPYTNSGEMKTWGFETTIGYNDQIGDLKYSIKAMLSDAQNEVVNFGGSDTYVPGLNFVREGYPVNTYFAYEFDGIIRTAEELAAYKLLGGVPSDIGIGDARFKDINGDGKISAYGDIKGDDGDVINAGSTTPRFIYGFNLNLKFRNFDFGMFLQGVGKRTLFREGDYAMPWSDWWRQPAQFYYGQTWSAERPNAPYPRLSHGNIRYWNYQKSTLQQINGAYARLKNLTVGYTIPAHLINRISISNLRIYFSGQDIWEKHSVKGGWDPESDTWGFNYPFQRYYSFGIDLNF
jgi:TonB-linked SusC/RagA family outer membrane protein